MKTIFVTGANGFIGRHLLHRLSESAALELLCLTRDPAIASSSAAGASTPRWIVGDLTDTDSYAEALAQSDVVVHLAAATGTANPEQLRKINELGTRALAEACKAVGVPRLLFVSSIAVKGADLDAYPYARSKLAAEKAVAESALDYTILRPTIVLAVDAPNWRMLRKLACLPLIPLFGGGRAQIQPVDVHDVVRAIELLIDEDSHSNVIVDIGGPEILTFATFLRRIRTHCGKTGFPALSVPIAPVRFFLTMTQRVLGNRTPVGPGQLAPFVNDAVASANPVFDQLRPQMRSLDELLRSVVDADLAD